MVWQTSPAAAELEEVVVDWLRQMIGLPDGFSGVIQDTASTATLCAFLSPGNGRPASRRTRPASGPLTVYASEEVHSSADKGVRIAGFGKKNFRRIPTDERFALVPEKLEEALARDKEAGLVPACVMATVGTTSSGAIDPLRAIGEICRKHGVWFHVDAAWAGTAALLPEKRWIMTGRAGRLAGLQSPQVDADQLRLHGLLRQGPGRARPDLRDPSRIPEDRRRRKVKNYRDWGIQLGRRFRPSSSGSSSAATASRASRPWSASTSGWRRSSRNGSRPTAASSCWPRSTSASSASVSTTAATRPPRRAQPRPPRTRQRRGPGPPDPHDPSRQVHDPSGRGPADDRGTARPRRLGHRLHRGRRSSEGVSPGLPAYSGLSA